MSKHNHEARQKGSLMKIEAITLRIATELIERGFVTLAHLKRASDVELLAVPGINEAKLEEIRAYCGGS